MSSKRILYIEDNFDNRILIKRILEAEGYTVVEAENGTKGLELALGSKPDLILMDINLPDIDGYECTTRLRKATEGKHVPIVALTANAMEGDVKKAMDAGCNGYIPKPIDVDNLPRQIEKYLKTDAQPPQTTSPPSPSIQPASSSTRPSIPSSPGFQPARPSTQPASPPSPSTQPVRPSSPGFQPARPSTQPASPPNPGSPTVNPSQPSTQPTSPPNQKTQETGTQEKDTRAQDAKPQTSQQPATQNPGSHTQNSEGPRI